MAPLALLKLYAFDHGPDFPLSVCPQMFLCPFHCVVLSSSPAVQNFVSSPRFLLSSLSIYLSTSVYLSVYRIYQPISFPSRPKRLFITTPISYTLPIRRPTGLHQYGTPRHFVSCLILILMPMSMHAPRSHKTQHPSSILGCQDAGPRIILRSPLPFASYT